MIERKMGSAMRLGGTCSKGQHPYTWEHINSCASEALEAAAQTPPGELTIMNS
jgi:hypothetical protein